MKDIKKLVETTEMFAEAYSSYVSVYHRRQRKFSLYEKEAQFVVLVHTLKKLKDEINMMDLSKELHLTPGAISQTASRAERKGYIKRVMSKSDRRSNIVLLTKKGEKFCQGYEDYMLSLNATLKKTLSGHSAHDINSFIEIQGKLAKMLRELSLKEET